MHSKYQGTEIAIAVAITLFCFITSISEPVSASGSILPYTAPVISTINSSDNPFPDNSSNLAGIAAAELYRRGVISGYADGEFKGGRAVNRAEAAKFLMLARYGNEAESQNLYERFPDTPSGEWYIPYIIKSADLGIINGYPDGKFRPDDAINTAEFIKMIALTFSLDENLLYDYNDVPDASWFARYAGATQKYGLFPQRLSYLYPDQLVTRNEVAVAIYQYLKAANGADAETDEQETTSDNATSQLQGLGPGSDYTKRSYTVQPLSEALKDKLGLIDWDDEEVQPMSAISIGNHYAVVPAGYEELGKAHVNDLIYCNEILDDFFGMPFPRDYMVVKVYKSNSETTGGFMGNGIVNYRKTAALLDTDLQDVVDRQETCPANTSCGFLYHSGPTSCSNTHELTHAYFYNWQMPSFIKEGLAEYTQSINQRGSKDHRACKVNGIYRQDSHGDGKIKLIPFVDLVPFSGDYSYDTAQCFLDELVGLYDRGDFIKDFAEQLRLKPFDYIRTEDHTREIFLESLANYIVEDVLHPLLGTKLYSILEKYGITEDGIVEY